LREKGELEGGGSKDDRVIPISDLLLLFFLLLSFLLSLLGHFYPPALVALLVRG